MSQNRKEALTFLFIFISSSKKLFEEITPFLYFFFGGGDNGGGGRCFGIFFLHTMTVIYINNN